jgi:hypothetical protein
MTTSFNFRTRKFRQRFKKFSFVFILIFLTIFVLVVFNIADLFSSAITNKGSLLYGEKIRIGNTIYYGISLYNSISVEKSEQQAQNILRQGGAGCIYHMGEYYVLGSIYSSHEDATEVKEKLDSDGVEAKIININIPVININYKGDKTKENTEIFSVFKTLFDSLHNLSIEFDMGSKTVQEFKKEINKISNDFSVKINDFDAIFKKEKYEFQKQIIEHLNRVKASLDAILTYDGVNLTLNGKIKNVCCEIVLEYYKLAKVI